MFKSLTEYELGWLHDQILWCPMGFSEDLIKSNQVHFPENFFYLLLFITYIYDLESQIIQNFDQDRVFMFVIMQ